MVTMLIHPFPTCYTSQLLDDVFDMIMWLTGENAAHDNRP